MAKTFQDTITVTFIGEGKGLEKTIKDLDKATKALLQTQAGMQKQAKKAKAQNEKGNAQYIRLKNTMLSYDKSIRDVTKDEILLAKARKGDAVALMKLSRMTKKYTRSLDRNKTSVLGTVHDTRILGGSFAVLRSRLLLVSFAAGIVGATIGRLTKLMGEQEKAEKKLETSIGKKSKALLAFASTQQQVTKFGDEETISAMSLVGAYTDNEKAIARVTKASMDLAVAKGIDLKSAVELMSKSIFSSTNALQRHGIAIEGSAGSTQRLESAVKNVSALFGGQAEADAETFLGSMTQLGNSVGDLGERFGLVLVPAIHLSAKGMRALTDSIDVEEIKAYGFVIVSAGTAWLAYTKGALIATRATALFNKVSKKNVAIFIGMLAVGALIDKFNIFASSTEDLTKELEDLEGALGNLNTRGIESLSLNHKLAMSQLVYANASQNTSDIESKRSVLSLEMNQLQEKHGVTQANFNRILAENIVFAIEYNNQMAQSVELERLAQQEKVKKVLEGMALITSSFSATTGALRTEMQSREAMELEQVRNSSGYAKASSDEKKALEKSVTAGFAQEKLKLWKMDKASNVANVIMSTASAMMKAHAQLGIFGTPMAALIAGLGAVQLNAVISTQPPSFEQGGLVGGRRHSQGGTIIEAEQGEFIMSRSAVESIGTSALNNMNQGGGGGITLNISAPLVDETVIDTIIPAIQKAQRMNLA